MLTVVTKVWRDLYGFTSLGLGEGHGLDHSPPVGLGLPSSVISPCVWRPKHCAVINGSIERIFTAYQCCNCKVNSYVPYLHIAQCAMLLMIPSAAGKPGAYFTKATCKLWWHQITQMGVAFKLSPTCFSHANARSLWHLKCVKSFFFKKREEIIYCWQSWRAWGSSFFLSASSTTVRTSQTLKCRPE